MIRNLCDKLILHKLPPNLSTCVFLIVQHISYVSQYEEHLNVFILSPGPGSSDSNPAPSCFLLFEKYIELPNGVYWVKKEKVVKKISCKRKGKFS